MRLTRTFRFAMVATGLAILAAACTRTNSAGATPTTERSVGGSATTVGTGSVSGLGRVIVSGSGRTLYMLTADSGGKVTCTSMPCTGLWPPLLLPAGSSVASAGVGLNKSLLGTVRTPNGALQVTFGHWPLYAYAGDASAGQANGQGIQSFGGVWHPLGRSGTPITATAASGSGAGGY
jgi:predicted lipoprotein with Yx(FWY)xxD motif